MTDRLSLLELESYLWGAATILRGLVDAGDYKQFIFPLLFYKRLSDVWDEDYAEALAETGDDEVSSDIPTANSSISASGTVVRSDSFISTFTAKLVSDRSEFCRRE